MSCSQRIFLYSQHLTGTGHFVRTFEIACDLAERHDVYLVDGGLRVPRPKSAAPIQLVKLPAIYRDGPNLLPVEPTSNIHDVMPERRKDLERAVKQIQPDVIIVEHFPFSKWELEQEITEFLELARNVRPAVRVICSFRDIAPGSQHDPNSSVYRRVVLQLLQTQVDRILVHSDPRLVRMDEYLPWAAQIEIPVDYTGYVSQHIAKNTKRASSARFGFDNRRQTVVVSAGGRDGSRLISQTIEAWRQLQSQPALDNYVLVVFQPLYSQVDEFASMQNQDKGAASRVPLCPDFIHWMQDCELSISQAGYNTCTNLLQTKARSILVPDPKMSDQTHRTRLFAERGLATTIDSATISPGILARTILEQLQAPPPQHNFHLDGARITREIVDRLANGEQGHFRRDAPLPPIQAA